MNVLRLCRSSSKGISGKWSLVDAPVNASRGLKGCFDESLSSPVDLYIRFVLSGDLLPVLSVFASEFAGLAGAR